MHNWHNTVTAGFMGLKYESKNNILCRSQAPLMTLIKEDNEYLIIKEAFCIEF